MTTVKELRELLAGYEDTDQVGLARGIEGGPKHFYTMLEEGVRKNYVQEEVGVSTYKECALYVIREQLKGEIDDNKVPV